MTQNGQFKKECKELEDEAVRLIEKYKNFLTLCEACYKLNEELKILRKDGQMFIIILKSLRCILSILIHNQFALGDKQNYENYIKKRNEYIQSTIKLIDETLKKEGK